eukprot:IDg9554t1
MTPFFWVALIELQPDVHPDDDMVLQAALSMNYIQSLLRSLGIPISTKMHRLMRHTGQLIRMFGCARRGDTDQKEVLHKSTKTAYAGTNNHTDTVAKQLLNVRSISDAEYANPLPLTTPTAVQYEVQAQNNVALAIVQHMRSSLQNELWRRMIYGNKSEGGFIRRLRSIPPEHGNTRVVNEFHHKRFAYDLHPVVDGDVILDCVLIP